MRLGGVPFLASPSDVRVSGVCVCVRKTAFPASELVYTLGICEQINKIYAQVRSPPFENEMAIEEEGTTTTIL